MDHAEGIVEQVSISKGGVPKLPILEGEVNELGIIGDLHANPKYHGGPRQAILWITAESLDQLKTEGFPLFHGALGENITTRGIDRREVRVGQRWRIGEVELEITKLRQPCKTLNPYGVGIQNAVFDHQVKAGDFHSPKWGLAGFYAAVIRPGQVRAGDSVALLSASA